MVQNFLNSYISIKFTQKAFRPSFVNLLCNDYEQHVNDVTEVTGHKTGEGRVCDNYTDKGSKHKVKLCKFIFQT